jgi:hypothetical protein
VSHIDKAVSSYVPALSVSVVTDCIPDAWEAHGHCMYGDAGRYLVQYEGPREGTYKMYVAQAGSGGLTGTYFNNRWLFGSPVFSRVDKVINFEWDEFITDTGKDFISVRWTGYVEPEFNEAYTFYVAANDGARLWVDNNLLFDDFENEVATGETFTEMKATTTTTLVAGRLYDILLEYRESKGMAIAKLYWSCDTQKEKSLIPSHHLYPSDQPIGGATFDNTAVKQSDHFVNIAEVNVASPFDVTTRGVNPLHPSIPLLRSKRTYP